MPNSWGDRDRFHPLPEPALLDLVDADQTGQTHTADITTQARPKVRQAELGGAACVRRRSDWSRTNKMIGVIINLPPRGFGPFHRQADRVGAKFRRSGGSSPSRNNASAERIAPKRNEPIFTESLEQQTGGHSEVAKRQSQAHRAELEPVVPRRCWRTQCASAKPHSVQCWLREGERLPARFALHNAPLEYAKFGETEQLLPPNKRRSPAFWKLCKRPRSAEQWRSQEPQSPKSPDWGRFGAVRY